MADISIFPLVRHLRGGPTMYLRHLRRGRLVHDGTGPSRDLAAAGGAGAPAH